MKTPKRQFPEMPTCPICGGELAEDTDDSDYHFNSYIYCKNNCDHITVGEDITKEDYEKLEEKYFRIRELADVYIVDKGSDLIRARWKRKNREAQLKRTIARLTKQVSHLKRRRHQALRIIDRERAVKNYALMMSGFYDKMDKMEGDIFLTQTYGHDIEGS